MGQGLRQVQAIHRVARCVPAIPQFLVDGNTGLVVKRYEPTTSPMGIEGDILKLLQ